MTLQGFGNYHHSESIQGTIPEGQNSPQKCPLGLYAEQVSGSAFARPRANNLKAWLYRKVPSVVQYDFTEYNHKSNDDLLHNPIFPPNPYRWSPQEYPTQKCDFIDGLLLVAKSPVVNTWLYKCTQSMEHRVFASYDGEFLIVPYQGEIILITEFGDLAVAPGYIAVIPRGIKFRVILNSAFAAGYIAENMATPLSIPNLGIIGANGLANPRHFIYPNAKPDEVKGMVQLIVKQQRFWQAECPKTPLNVVAWHGNYAPYSYDLKLFNTLGSVSFDHPDPSIFTVLSSESAISGVANLDFVIFPERWMVSEHTFRPPYFHRNVMSELMGLIFGQYDAKQTGFLPGGISIHNAMSGHGPDNETVQLAYQDNLVPKKYTNTLAFMFEIAHPWQVTSTAYKLASRQKNYSSCWHSLLEEFSL